MKKLILTVVMIMGLSAANTTNANDHIYKPNFVESDLSVKALDGLKFKVTALNVAEKSTLEIKDDQGQVLYKAMLENQNYIKVFNLSSLPDGSYSLVLKTGKESTVKPFEIKTETTRLVSNL